MKRVLLGLGSNRDFNGMSSIKLLSLACKELEAVLDKPLFSSVYRTKAMYVTDQNDFYNMAAVGFVTDETSPFDLLKIINKIEAKFGRNRSNEIRFGPRSLDIDIELFGDEQINTDILQIPHIRLKERAFVLIPALEILDKSADENIREMFESYVSSLPDTDDVKLIEKLTVGLE